MLFSNYSFLQKNLERSKKDWELAHIQTAKVEEERRAGAENLDESVEVTFTTEESRQVKKSKNKSSNSKKGKEKAISTKAQPKSGASTVKPRAVVSAGSQGSVVSRAVRSTRRSAVENRNEGVS